MTPNFFYYFFFPQINNLPYLYDKKNSLYFFFKVGQGTTYDHFQLLVSEAPSSFISKNQMKSFKPTYSLLGKTLLCLKITVVILVCIEKWLEKICYYKITYIFCRDYQHFYTLHDIGTYFQLRYLQTLTGISAENNSTIIFPLPIDFISSYMKK